tara:strand:- start:18376 stop:18642 length:267 start_codon:yes stop_codon:yes gene_type:complete
LVSATRRAVWNGDFSFFIVEEDIPKLKREQVLVKVLCSGNYFLEAVNCLSRLDFTNFKGKFYSLDNIVAGFKNSIDANDIKTFIKSHY